MSEQTYTYHNDSFNLNQAYNYTLLIQIEEASFSYAVIYNDQLVLLDTNCSLDELLDPQELYETLTADYKEVIIGLPATGYTLVPPSIYSPEHVAVYARYLNVNADEKVLSQVLDDKNYIVYKTSDRVIKCAQKFDLKNAVYANKGWIKAIAQTHPANNTLYINTSGNKADFLYFKDDAIRFYNSFECITADDLAYYAAFVADELGLDNENTNLVLSGSISPGDDHSNRLGDFFNDITFNSIPVIELPNDIPAHQLITLAALSLCASSVEV